MKVLNLYAGIGGNRKHWDNCEVTAIESQESIANIYKKLFPADTVIIGDAHKYLLKHVNDFDFIWSSPPCQSHSRMTKANCRIKERAYIDLAMYQEILYLQNFCRSLWLVENVKPYYVPLVLPSKTIGRHIFWSNFEIGNFSPPVIANFINRGTLKDAEKLKKFFGLNYRGNVYYKKNHCPVQVLRNCVHPIIGAHIFNYVRLLKV